MYEKVYLSFYSILYWIVRKRRVIKICTGSSIILYVLHIQISLNGSLDNDSSKVQTIQYINGIIYPYNFEEYIPME